VSVAIRIDVDRSADSFEEINHGMLEADGRMMMAMTQSLKASRRR
jgi:hypothetical protein